MACRARAGSWGGELGWGYSSSGSRVAELETVGTERAPCRKGYGWVQEQGACVGRGQTPYIPEGQGHLGDWRGARPGVCAGEPLAVLTRTAREREGKMPTYGICSSRFASQFPVSDLGAVTWPL